MIMCQMTIGCKTGGVCAAGPQDHGWCSGYTCQKRLSLFHSLVATGKGYDVFFSSVTPQKLRFMLLNAEPSEVRGHALLTLVQGSFHLLSLSLT